MKSSSMKVNISKNWWGKANFLAKICLWLGAFFMDLAMKLYGMEEAE